MPKAQIEDVQSFNEGKTILRFKYISNNIIYITESKFKLSNPDAFGVKNLVKIKNLFDAGVHYGHTEGTLDERMKQYLYGNRLGHLIINLNHTKRLLQQALNVTAHISYR